MPLPKIHRLLVLLPVSAACLLLSAAPARAQQQAAPCVTIGGATLCGQVSKEGAYHANEYLGIRYSRAGRFEAKDTPIAPVSTTATVAGAVCPQIVPGLDKPVGEEDCLFLNVWTPTGATPASRLPVAVYIHGGAFIQGASTGVDGNPMLFDGTELSNQAGGLVVVTLNYRLGALGFLTYSDGTSSLAGNYGFLDQVAALKWVKAYIQPFGGDPQKVMIFGQSAGAASVGLHAWSSNSSAGTFQSFIMESNPLGVGVPTPATAKQTGEDLVKAYNKLTHLNCNTISCLRGANADDLSKAAFSVYKNDIASFATGTAPTANKLLPWGPNLDGSVIIRQPIAGARTGPIRGNYVFGTNSAEGVYFEDVLDVLSIPVNATFYGNFLASLFGGTPPTGLPPQYVCPAGSDDCGAQFARLITDYVFTCPNRLTSILSASRGGFVSSYGYQFRHVPSFGYPSFCTTEVCHSAELPFVWDNDVVATENGSSFTPQEETLGATMSKLWAFMAASGQPKSATILNTPWRPLSPGDNYLIFDLGSFAVNNTPAVDASCGYWDQQGYPGTR